MRRRCQLTTEFTLFFSLISTNNTQPILLRTEGQGEDTPHPHNSTKVTTTVAAAVVVVVVVVVVVAVVACNPMREFSSVLKGITGPGSHGPTAT